jgi:hypothetical protein
MVVPRQLLCRRLKDNGSRVTARCRGASHGVRNRRLVLLSSDTMKETRGAEGFGGKLDALASNI